ncbi:putative pentatricopeptide repeat-containing protein At3g15130 [Impatiens glandulifera]|uniref:putative pentatricopeptide repeat-containing protein At3g15130 n=1 Tax=Impatiens glandulifera TaxID=253017 RepID=UPI001FB10B97|nr:putative pentatricopeptide repeat-containing protein At3g15130 [Impatiens glandulifera]
MMINERRLRIAEILKKCGKHGLIDEGRKAHAAAFINGYWFEEKISNDIVHMYSKCSRMDLACQVFDRMPKRNVVSWTLLMCGYLQQRKPTETLLLLRRMHSSDERPNEFTFSTCFKACGLLCFPENGMQIHGLCVRTGFESFSEVGNSMIDMYSRCDRIKESERCFNVMPVRTVVSWNAMIAGYASSDKEMGGDKALDLLRKMQREEEIIPDEFTFTSSLRACNCVGGIREGSQIHAYLIKRWFNVSLHEITSGALVDLYVKTGNLSSAHKVFDEIQEKNIVLWSSLIQGYAQQRSLEEAMNLFRQLRKSRTVKVDGFTLSSMISIFADFALAEQGKQMHSYATKVPYGLWVSVSNSIVDMYMKCGLLDEAEKHFNEMEEKNLVSWTVMITGYGKYGFGRKAIDLFEKMMLNAFEPDRVTHLALLSACSHSGLIEEGKKFFSEISDKKLGMEHYGSMCDLLGRGGLLEEAKKLIENMSVRPEVGIWQSLLSACRVHRNVEMAKEVGETLLRLDSDNPVNYVMISNVYADCGLWEESERLRGLARIKGLKKEIGRSWVEIDKVVQFFSSGDETHPLTEEIHSFLREMETRLKEEVGYCKEVKFALYDVEEESKAETLRFHSEKLAIGLALIHGGSGNKKGVIIRVFKNLRVCGDCHEFIKGLSKILKTVLLVRDANRFHKFEDGKCSCGDYW